MPPGKLCLGTRLYGDNGVCFARGVGPAVADDVVRGDFSDRLCGCQSWVRLYEQERRTPSYEGTRTPSPTAPPFRETNMVCADADDAAAARARDVESFIVCLRCVKTDSFHQRGVCPSI